MNIFYVENVETLNKNLSRIGNSCALRILQLSIRGMDTLEKFDKLKELLDDYTGYIDLLVIGETWLKSDRTQLF